jgi:hypothetical protein
MPVFNGLAGLVRDALAAKQRHQGAGHGRDQFLLALLRRKCLRVANGDGSAGLEDARPKQKIIASSRGDEVGLEFDGQNRRIVGHQRERGIAAGGIERGRDDAGVDKAMLLRIRGGVRHPQFDLAGPYAGDFNAQRRHRGLAPEAGPDTGLEVCILRIESRHLSPRRRLRRNRRRGDVPGSAGQRL